jgi:hypothetical protein
VSQYFSDACDADSACEGDIATKAMAEGYDIVEYYEKADSGGDGQIVLFRDDLLFERSRLQAILRQLLNDGMDDEDGDTSGLGSSEDGSAL